MELNEMHPLVRMALAKRDEVKMRESTVETLQHQMQQAIERHDDSLEHLTEARDELAALEDAMTGDQRAQLVQVFLSHDGPTPSKLAAIDAAYQRFGGLQGYLNQLCSHSHSIGNGGV